ncbi:MAG: glycosyltransferase family 4 protein [Planctomycetota bacterium]
MTEKIIRPKTIGARCLKVILLTDELAYRGSGLYTLNLAEGLQQLGHRIKIICAGGPLSEEFKKLKIEVTSFEAINHWTNDLFLSAHLADEIKSAQADILHIQKIRLAGLGAAIAAKSQIPYFITVQNTLNIPHRLKLASKFIRGIIAVTEEIREHLVNETKVPRELVQLIHAGVNYRRIKENVSSSPEQIKRDSVVAILGPLETWRGHQYFLKAAREILAAGYKVKFLIIGEGETEPELRKLVATLGIRDSVIFIPDITKYYLILPTVDIFVLPYLQMGMGLSLLEAMACGRPVIASSVGESYHFIKENETGFLVPPKNHEAIKEKIVELLNDKILALEVGLRARRFVEENFSAEKMTQKINELYFSCLPSNGRNLTA